MSAAPSEPEKYSIDEMMDRLKNAPSENPEDGELVTRSDGTQAIRVRKRKRRSSQPHKDLRQQTRRARIFQVSAALILVFVAALAIGGGILFANSSPFREGLVGKIEKASGAKAELMQFRMNPKTANAGSLALTWPEGNVLKNLSLRAINAEIFPSSFLGKSMTGEEITVTEGILALRIPVSGESARATPAGEETPAIRFSRYRTPKLKVLLGDPAVLSLVEAEGSLSPHKVSGRPQLSLYQGELFVRGWPKLRLDRALIEIRGNEADIIGLRVLHESDDRGAFELSGTVTPYKPAQSSTLAVSLDSFQISGITGPALGRFFSGRIDSVPLAKSNFLSFLPTENPATTLDVTFRVSPTSKIEVQGFPFLFALAQTLDEDSWFERPVFEEDSGGVIHREGGIISIREINFESKGRMALRGEISIAANQTLSGNLQLGVAEAMFASATTPRLKTMFGQTREGFRWATLKISGTAAAPVDNFKELYLSAKTDAPQSSPEAELGGSTFEELTRPK